MTGGRPSGLTEDLIQELEEKAASYWSINDACAMLGITDTTWRKWRKRGNAEIEEWGEQEEECLTAHARFARLAARVGAPRRRTICAGVLQTIIMDKDAKDSDRLQAALGLLRLDHTAKLEVTGADGGALEVAVKEWGESIRAMIDGPAADDVEPT